MLTTQMQHIEFNMHDPQRIIQPHIAFEIHSVLCNQIDLKVGCEAPLWKLITNQMGCEAPYMGCEAPLAWVLMIQKRRR